MNILMIGHFQHSGRTQHILTLSNELSRLGHRVSILMPGLPSHFHRFFNKYFKKVMITKPEKFKLNNGIDLLHLHSTEEIALVDGLSRKYSLPYVCTLHENLPNSLKKDILTFYNRASTVICPHPIVFNELKNEISCIIHIPEGVNIIPYRRDLKRTKKAVYIAEEGNYIRESYRAVLKAVSLAGLPLEIISHDKPLSSWEHHRGWMANTAPILSKSDIVITAGRALLEGIANHNVALILGTNYNGIFYPPDSSQKDHPDYSGRKGQYPCYRDIFNDLSALIKDSDFRYSLQDKGYKYARQYFNIKAITRQMLRLYENAVR